MAKEVRKMPAIIHRSRDAAKKAAQASVKQVPKSENMPPRFIPVERRSELKAIAKISGGRALLRALLRYYLEDDTAARNKIYDQVLCKATDAFEASNHEKELRDAYVLMREIYDEIFLTPAMKEEAHEELNHVIGGAGK